MVQETAYTKLRCAWLKSAMPCTNKAWDLMRQVFGRELVEGTWRNRKYDGITPPMPWAHFTTDIHRWLKYDADGGEITHGGVAVHRDVDKQLAELWRGARSQCPGISVMVLNPMADKFTKGTLPVTALGFRVCPEAILLANSVYSVRIVSVHKGGDGNHSLLYFAGPTVKRVNEIITAGQFEVTYISTCNFSICWCISQKQHVHTQIYTHIFRLTARLCRWRPR